MHAHVQYVLCCMSLNVWLIKCRDVLYMIFIMCVCVAGGGEGTEKCSQEDQEQGDSACVFSVNWLTCM